MVGRLPFTQLFIVILDIDNAIDYQQSDAIAHYIICPLRRVLFWIHVTLYFSDQYVSVHFSAFLIIVTLEELVFFREMLEILLQGN